MHTETHIGDIFFLLSSQCARVQNKNYGVTEGSDVYRYLHNKLPWRDYDAPGNSILKY